MDRQEPLAAPIEGARLQNPTIRFRSDRDITPRIWYHVPRIGDFVDLGPDGSGRVTDVCWTVHEIIVDLD